jgi:hypothetical protein
MKVKVYVIDVPVPAFVKNWGLRLGIPTLAILGGGVAFAGLPVTYVDGQTLHALDLNNNFNYLQMKISALEASISSLQASAQTLTQTSSVDETSVSNGDLVYQGVSLSLTPGTWAVWGFGTGYTLQSVDQIQLGLYNDTLQSDVPNSRGASTETTCTATSSNGCAAALNTFSVLTVTSATVIMLKAYRNGVSQVGLGNHATNFSLPATNGLTAVQLL